MPISCAACCWEAVCWLLGVASVVWSVDACALLSADKLDWVAPDRSLNVGWSATSPVTVAPARPAACLIPEITADEAPGSVTSTTRHPGQLVGEQPRLGRLVRNCWSALTCCS